MGSKTKKLKESEVDKCFIKCLHLALCLPHYCDLWLTCTEISLHVKITYGFIFSHPKNSKVHIIIAEKSINRKIKESWKNNRTQV